jgi:hypothetical protein
MASVDCKFEITTADGGDLKGKMFGPTTGRIRRGDSLVVIVDWLAPAAVPNALQAHYMFSMAPSADQVFASPFQAANQRQLTYKGPVPSGPPNGSTFTFPGLTIPNTQPITVFGKYELTFVVEDPSSQTQWSEDPEFDVDG